jgi:hypothetical protein
VTELEIYELAQQLLESNGLHNWVFAVVDDLPQFDVGVGFTYIDEKRIEISRETWPISDTNVTELIRHEVAHAICNHGCHNSEWWQTLTDIGGNGIWLEEDNSPANWSWTLAKAKEND